jgi:hypothetical protein
MGQAAAAGRVATVRRLRWNCNRKRLVDSEPVATARRLHAFGTLTFRLNASGTSIWVRPILQERNEAPLDRHLEWISLLLDSNPLPIQQSL